MLAERNELALAVHVSETEIEDIETRKENLIILRVLEITGGVLSDKGKTLEREKLKEIYEHVDVDANEVITCLKIGKYSTKTLVFECEGDNSHMTTCRQQECAKMLREELISRNLNNENRTIRNGKLMHRPSAKNLK